jgi:WhiB family redox-sensing transcriptional regulator
MIQELESKNEWRAHAACRNFNPDIFFPGITESRELAMSICAECPVREICLEENLDERAGIYGGTSGRQRIEIRKNRYSEGKCVHCQKIFIRTGRNQVLCSEGCRLARHKSQKAKSRRYVAK